MLSQALQNAIKSTVQKAPLSSVGFDNPMFNAEQFTFVFAPYAPSPNSFSVPLLLEKDKIKEVSRWWTCREEFDPNFTTGTAFIGFGVKDSCETQNIVAFFSHIESVLKIKDNTTFQETTLVNMIMVRPAPFWKESRLRRQLFTIFLRCGRAYVGDLDAALNSQLYSKDTMPAVKRFLEGFTALSKESTDRFQQSYGWWSFFSPHNGANSIYFLITPEEAKAQSLQATISVER